MMFTARRNTIPPEHTDRIGRQSAALAEMTPRALVAVRSALGRRIALAPARPLVLLIDDRGADLELAARALADFASPICALRATAAFDLLRASPAIGLVITDLYLPGTSGDVILEARRFRPDLRVILYSAAEVAQIQEEARRTSATAWIQKTGALTPLVEAVRQCLGAQGANGKTF